MAILTDCEPRSVFSFFEEICSIPHGSGNIDKISDYLSSFAKERGLEYVQEDCGNVIIYKNASPGYENEPGVIIQGHMDMVEAVESAYRSSINMKTDGLSLAVKGDYVYAKHTSLGGDDGIAVAMALALLDSEDIPHPKLQAIFTVNEEVGMDGASELNPELLRYKKLINIDNEIEGQIISGCAGGGRVVISLPLKKNTQPVSEKLSITICDGIGGHSGIEIDKGRANTNMLAGEILSVLQEKFADKLVLADIDGGSADNAIPSMTRIILGILEDEQTPSQSLVQDITEVIAQKEADICKLYMDTDPNLRVVVEISGNTEASDSADRCEKLLDVTYDTLSGVAFLLESLPNGIMAMSPDVEGLVETSLNLGILKLYTDKDKLQLQFAVRSSVEQSKTELIDRLKDIANKCGAQVEVTGLYPGWKYRVDSPLRDKCIAVYEQMYGAKPVVEAIHAGLECGFFISKDEEIDCVSIGPNILDIHTPREKLSISSTANVWEYLCKILEK